MVYWKWNYWRADWYISFFNLEKNYFRIWLEKSFGWVDQLFIARIIPDDRQSQKFYNCPLNIRELVYEMSWVGSRIIPQILRNEAPYDRKEQKFLEQMHILWKVHSQRCKLPKDPSRQKIRFQDNSTKKWSDTVSVKYQEKLWKNSFEVSLEIYIWK